MKFPGAFWTLFFFEAAANRDRGWRVQTPPPPPGGGGRVRGLAGRWVGVAEPWLRPKLPPGVTKQCPGETSPLRTCHCAEAERRGAEESMRMGR